MNPGKMDKRLKFYELSDESDGAGGNLDNWQTGEGYTLACKRWGSITPSSGREIINAQQTDTEITHRIKVRYSSKINDTQIIIYNSRKFEIQYIRNIEEKNFELEILAVERT